MATLFAALAELLALPGDVRAISPDAKREYAALTRRVRQAITHHVVKSRVAQKRARTYLEARIIAQAEKCGTKPKGHALKQAALDVIGLSKLDFFSFWLAERLSKKPDEIAACIGAAAALGPRDGRFVSPGRQPHAEGVPETRRRLPRSERNFGDLAKAYETRLRALCKAIGLEYAPPSTRSPARSRAKKRGA